LGCLWATRKRQSGAALVFTCAVGLTGVIDHVGSVLRFVYSFLISRGAILRFLNFSTMLSLALALVFAFMTYKIFRVSKLLYGRGFHPKGFKIAGALTLLALCYVSPFVDYKGAFEAASRKVRPGEWVALYAAGARVLDMSASPDGKLLALGTRKGIQVWDAESRRKVWSDDNLAARRVRFSGDGKHLAAAGKSLPEGVDDLAVFQVERFRRLPDFDWAGDDPRKEKVIHDLAFRPDGKNLLVAWHREWNWNQTQEGPYSEEARALRRKDGETKKLLTCTEINIENGEIEYSKKIPSFPNYGGKMDDEGIHFSPDASSLLYSREDRSNGQLYSLLYRVNTHTFMEEEMTLKPYRMYVRFGGATDKPWQEWQFIDNDEICFLTYNSFAKFNLTTRQAQEIVKEFSSNITSAWIRVASSPDKKRAALLGLGEAYNNYGGSKKNIATVRIVDLEAPNKTKVLVCRYRRSETGNHSVWARHLAWLSGKTVAVALDWDVGPDEGWFFFIDAEENR
jgi:WD40 repeat protein